MIFISHTFVQTENIKISFLILELDIGAFSEFIKYSFLSFILTLKIFLSLIEPPFLGTSIFTPAVIIVDITIKKIEDDLK